MVKRKREKKELTQADILKYCRSIVDLTFKDEETEGIKTRRMTREIQKKKNKGTLVPEKHFLLLGTNDEYTEDEEYARAFNHYRERFVEARKRKAVMTNQQMKTLLGFGYSFTPSEGMLVDYYLRNKVLDEPTDYCVIEEVDNVYNIHPQDLAGVSQAWYFFTRSPFELQSSDVLARWICSSEKEDIYLKDVKVRVKQRFEFCEGRRSRYSITEYQLCSPPENPKNDHWFVCQLKMIGNFVDVHT